MADRAFPRDLRLHNGKVHSALIVKCRKCGAEDFYTVAGGKGGATKYFQKRGWEIGRGPTMDICYMCTKPSVRVHKPKEKDMSDVVKADPPREMSRDDRRIIFAKIDEIYVGSAYQAPWTDVAVAKDLGVPLAWVAKVRDEMFGPAGSNPEIDAVLSEISGLRAAINRMQSDIGGLSAKVAAAETAAAKISKAVGR